MNKFYAFLLLPVLLLSCGKSKEPATMTLLTYNVGVFSKYEDDTTPQVAELIRNTGASLVALNELDSCNRRHASTSSRNSPPSWATGPSSSHRPSPMRTELTATGSFPATR